MSVAAYAQSAVRQGIDAAFDGTSVDSESEPFQGWRSRSIALNLQAGPSRIDDAEVKYGKGLVRIQFDGKDQDTATGSPFVVLFGAKALDDERETVIRQAAQSVLAIGREVTRESLQSALVLAQRLRDISRRRRIAEAALIVGVAAGITAWALWPRKRRRLR